jgi:hypothetical protein
MSTRDANNDPQAYGHLWASTSHNLIGLRGLLQGPCYFFYLPTVTGLYLHLTVLVVFWLVHFEPEYGGCTILRNVGSLPQHMVWHPRSCSLFSLLAQWTLGSGVSHHVAITSCWFQQTLETKIASPQIIVLVDALQGWGRSQCLSQWPLSFATSATQSHFAVQNNEWLVSKFLGHSNRYCYNVRPSVWARVLGHQSH